MSFYDPNIYNENNLKENDRLEIEYWRSAFECAISNASEDIEYSADELGEGVCVNIKNFLPLYEKKLKQKMEAEIYESIVSMIDNYNTEDKE